VSEEIEYRVAKLSPRPGEVLVLSVDGLSSHLSTEEGTRRVTLFARRFADAIPPGVHLMLLDTEEKIEHLTMGEIEYRIAWANENRKGAVDELNPALRQPSKTQHLGAPHVQSDDK
jgi:hypothetical protein